MPLQKVIYSFVLFAISKINIFTMLTIGTCVVPFRLLNMSLVVENLLCQRSVTIPSFRSQPKCISVLCQLNSREQLFIIYTILHDLVVSSTQTLVLNRHFVPLYAIVFVVILLFFIYIVILI